MFQHAIHADSLYHNVAYASARVLTPGGIKSRATILQLYLLTCLTLSPKPLYPSIIMGHFWSVVVRESFIPPATQFHTSDIPDMSGKVVLVTGANAGIGKETARVRVSSLLHAN